MRTGSQETGSCSIATKWRDTHCRGASCWLLEEACRYGLQYGPVVSAACVSMRVLLGFSFFEIHVVMFGSRSAGALAVGWAAGVVATARLHLVVSLVVPSGRPRLAPHLAGFAM